VDIVSDGPHAIVGGTTGSGKSELLIAWVLALATRYSPAEVSVLLVDFKGGSSFGNLTDLPHCVGLITDLDEVTARRALKSLAAEITFRERTLRTAGARSIGEFAEQHRLPRLVIVVDEFAAMANEYPDLHALFSDIAARGRSLGLHLILCTQRPAGVIRESVFANSGLRISLRVNNKADSTAVIDSDAAARLPADVRGRAILSISGDVPRAIQCALAVPDDVEPIIAQFADWPLPRRPWLDQLPSNIPLDDVWKRLANANDATSRDVLSEVLSDVIADETVMAVPFGVLDAPDRQEQPVAFWQPLRDGHMLVVGQSRSGKSVCAQTIRSAAIRSGIFVDVSSPLSAEAVWDAVCSALTSMRSGGGPKSRLVILDDLDAMLPRLSAEHQADLADRLVQVLREGPTQGVYFAITVQRVTSVLQQASVLFGSKLILSLASREDHVMAGGTPKLYSERSHRGSGSWRGERVQVAVGEASATCVPLDVEQFSPAGSFSVVSTAPRVSAARVLAWVEQRGAKCEIVELGSNTSVSASSLMGVSGSRTSAAGASSTRSDDVSVSRGETPRVMIGDPESWQSHWGALGQARSVTPVIIDGCSPAEFRTLTRERTLPPPLEAGANQFWLLMPNREVVRAQFATHAAPR
jgi:S-DNA-T family DNA segregation ATPase FtsK/SpoIIIE